MTDTDPTNPEVPPADTVPPVEPTPPAEPVAATPAPEARVVDSPVVHVGKPMKRHNLRFLLLYGGLALVAIAAIAGFVALVANPSKTASSSGWSNWKPPHGTNGKMASEIADHVQREYKLNKKGTPLLAVVAGPPTVTSGTHKVAISHLAIRRSAQSDKGIQIVPSGSTWTMELCGIGSLQCSIAAGTPSETRGRLVRREALEAALYTFKFVPAIDSVVAFMPPPPGQAQSTLLYLQRAQLQKELSQPLSKTLPLATPPLPANGDSKEAATIDKLTLPALYSYKLQQLQDASALLVLDPFQS